jgi:hypothetical protein
MANQNPSKPVEDSAKDEAEDSSLLRKIEAKMQSGRSTARTYDSNGYPTQGMFPHGTEQQTT